MIFAIDFDGTLTTGHYYPHVGELNRELVSKAIQVRKNGHKLILWTCRGGMELAEAVEACQQVGLEFDAVNENLNPSEKFNPRKVFAHFYIDDRNASIDEFIEAKI